MEKIEKILLLAVLGVALLIVGVMAFLPQDLDPELGKAGGAGEIYESMGERRDGGFVVKDFDGASRRAPADAGNRPGRGASEGGEGGEDTKLASGGPGSSKLNPAGEGGRVGEGGSSSLPLSPVGGGSLGDGSVGGGSVGGGSSDVGADDATAASGAGGDAAPSSINAVPSTPAEIALHEIQTHPRHPAYALYRVQRNDTLSTIIQSFCVNSSEALDAILKVNERLVANPDRLSEGEQIMIPKRYVVSRAERIKRAAERAMRRRSVSVMDASTRAPSAGPVRAGSARSYPVRAGSARSYKVKKGESLWVIAAREVGKRAAARYIDRVRALNPGLQPKRIRDGSMLKLPSAAWTQKNSRK